jgi:hypothetical protein
VAYSGYTDDLSADLGVFGGRLEPSNYRERSLGSVGVAPRPLIADLMSRVRSPQAIGHTVRDSLWSSMRICVSSLQIAVFFQTFRMNSSGHFGSFGFGLGERMFRQSDSRCAISPVLYSKRRPRTHV